MNFEAYAKSITSARCYTISYFLLRNHQFLNALFGCAPQYHIIQTACERRRIEVVVIAALLHLPSDAFQASAHRIKYLNRRIFSRFRCVTDAYLRGCEVRLQPKVCATPLRLGRSNYAYIDVVNISIIFKIRDISKLHNRLRTPCRCRQYDALVSSLRNRSRVKGGLLARSGFQKVFLLAIYFRKRCATIIRN